MKMTDFFLLLFAGLALIVAGMHLAPAHWQHVFGVAFKIVIGTGALFLCLLLLALGGESEKKKLEELLAELEAQSQLEERPSEGPQSQSHTSGNTGEDGEALEPVFRVDKNTGEMREIRPGRYVPGPVELEIKIDE